MSYGEKLENTLIQLKLDSGAKHDINFLTHRKALLEQTLKHRRGILTPEEREDFQMQLRTMPEHIENLEIVKASVKGFVTMFYN